jgi:hypothetical protein
MAPGLCDLILKVLQSNANRTELSWSLAARTTGLYIICQVHLCACMERCQGFNWNAARVSIGFPSATGSQGQCIYGNKTWHTTKVRDVAERYIANLCCGSGFNSPPSSGMYLRSFALLSTDTRGTEIAAIMHSRWHCPTCGCSTNVNNMTGTLKVFTRCIIHCGARTFSVVPHQSAFALSYIVGEPIWM